MSAPSSSTSSSGGTLVARDIHLSLGSALILDGVSLTVAPGSRFGIVGPNGVGKSTLLRILAGMIEPDAGAVSRVPATGTVGYLAQEVDLQPDESLRAWLGRRTGVAAASDSLDAATEALATDPEGAADAYAAALDHWLALGGADLDARAAKTCASLNLPPDRLDVDMTSLSGGQVARAGLAAILLSRFDIFLLDEPTNDLDFDGLARLESFVNSLAGGAVIVSHDRAFLARTVQRVVEIDEGTHQAKEFGGGWEGYLEAREVARRHQYEAHAKTTGERDRLMDRARMQKQWAETGVSKAKKNPPDNDKAQRGFKVNRTEKQASKVRITEKALERLDVVDKPWEGWELHMDFDTGGRSGDVVATLRGAVVERGSFRLGPVDLDIGWAERVAIIGPNGTGKTTLLQAMLGRLPLTAGERTMGPGVVVGELDQGRKLFLGGGDLISAFVEESGILAQEARSLLAKFGLSAAHVVRPAHTLSPGERTRAVLALLTALGVNCLVLDEPTNHLDLPAIEQLEQALDTFEGTLLLVTHDRELLERVELTRTIELDPSAPGGLVSRDEAPA